MFETSLHLTCTHIHTCRSCTRRSSSVAHASHIGIHIVFIVDVIVGFSSARNEKGASKPTHNHRLPGRRGFYAMSMSRKPRTFLGFATRSAQRPTPRALTRSESCKPPARVWRGQVRSRVVHARTRWRVVSICASTPASVVAAEISKNRRYFSHSRPDRRLPSWRPAVPSLARHAG